MTEEADLLRKNNIRIINQAVLTIEYCRKQQFFWGMRHSANTIQQLMNGMDHLISMLPVVNQDAPFVSVESLLEMMNRLQQAQAEKDYVLLCDLLEADLLPIFLTCQQRLIQGEQVFVDETLLKNNVLAMEEVLPGTPQVLFRFDICKEYRETGWLSDEGFRSVLAALQRIFQKQYVVEFTASGQYTVAVPGNRIKSYLHSNNVICRESNALAEEWLSQQKENYLFYGLGFGYPYSRMIGLDANIEIKVVEGNLDLLLLAVVFAPLAGLLKNPRFELVVDITNRRFFELAGQMDGCYVHYPSLKGIRSLRFRQKLEEVFIRESSVRTQGKLMDSNFRKNQKMDLPSVWSLQEQFQGKELYIIAGGPSLDKNIEMLKQLKNRDNALILAAGTVLKKLLAADIIPDFGIVTDVSRGLVEQIDGVEDCKVPLLVLSTASSQVMQEYQGEKYRIYQEGYLQAEQVAEKEGIETLNTGGSVITAAMEVGVRLGCGRIIFVGLDLAYTGGKDHAEETASSNEVREDSGLSVEAVDGTRLMTGRNLNIYRKWLEKKIVQMRDAGDFRPVIDATEGGARKQGMEVMTLQEVIEHLKE